MRFTRESAAAVLGIALPADPDEVSRAFKSRARLLHPDSFAEGSSAKISAESAMKDLNEAREVLLSPVLSAREESSPPKSPPQNGSKSIEDWMREYELDDELKEESTRQLVKWKKRFRSRIFWTAVVLIFYTLPLGIGVVIGFGFPVYQSLYSPVGLIIPGTFHVITFVLIRNAGKEISKLKIKLSESRA
jgi:hypothetical protein